LLACLIGPVAALLGRRGASAANTRASGRCRRGSLRTRSSRGRGQPVLEAPPPGMHGAAQRGVSMRWNAVVAWARRRHARAWHARWPRLRLAAPDLAGGSGPCLHLAGLALTQAQVPTSSRCRPRSSQLATQCLTSHTLHSSLLRYLHLSPSPLLRSHLAPPLPQHTHALSASLAPHCLSAHPTPSLLSLCAVPARPSPTLSAPLPPQPPHLTTSMQSSHSDDVEVMLPLDPFTYQRRARYSDESEAKLARGASRPTDPTIPPS
jgi:hypothetical protein